MPYCTGCSKLFKYLEKERCVPCLESLPNLKPRTEWPTCVDCSQRFEFLKTSQCVRCKERDDTSAMPPPGAPTTPLSSHDNNRDLHYAMAHPINVRTHGTPNAAPYFNPHQPSSSQFHNENDPRALSAQTAFEDFQHGYVDAVGRTSSQKVAKPKFRGAESSTTKPTLKIHVIVQRIINDNNKSITTPFDPQLVSYEDTRLWVDIEKNILAWLDGVYNQAHSHRIQSCDEFSLWYTQGRCSLNQITKLAGTTLKDLWRVSTVQSGLLVTVKNEKVLRLELDAHVKYPIKDDDSAEYESDLLGNNGPKRKSQHSTRTESSARPYKRSNTSAYHTSNVVSMAGARPTANQDIFIVKKLTVKLGVTPGDVEWTESPETFTVLIDKNEFSAGKTKKAFKLRFTNSSPYYAAKSFYNIGSYASPTNEENHQHLKEELARQLALGVAVSEFTRVAQENKIPVHNLQMAMAFMVCVCDGDRSWLIDPLLNYHKMRKFSGTDTAGMNDDFAGMTCDAFAHFTLIDSELEFVPADIQGIDTEVMKDGIRCANTITLFDVMAHSKSTTMGLGDSGLEGIQQFCKQHKCNNICKRFKLPHTEAILRELNNVTNNGNSQRVAKDSHDPSANAKDGQKGKGMQDECDGTDSD